MLRKLQWKFILINMALVGVVIISVIAAICINTYAKASNTVTEAMTVAYQFYTSGETGIPEIVEDPSGSGDPKYSKLGRVSTFVTVYDKSGSLIATDSRFGSMNAKVYSAASKRILDSDEAFGRLGNTSLAFYKVASDDRTIIVYADAYAQLTYAKQQIIQSVWFGLLSLIILFMISILLSRIALRPIEKAWEQQHQFVADASHELKTPLTVILANNDILMSSGHMDKTVREERQWVESTRAEAAHMKKLVDNLLFLARSDAAADHTKNMVCSEVILSDLAMDSCLQFDPVAFEKGVTLNDDIDPGIAVIGDRTQLRQLTHILIDNAIKYAGAGGSVYVRVRVEAQAAMLEVNNTGAVIPKEDIKHIFERFYRADKARTLGGGYGLGLAIAKRIVETHCGVITCASNPENGTTFTAALPLPAARQSGIFRKRSQVKCPCGEDIAVTSNENCRLSFSPSAKSPLSNDIIEADYDKNKEGTDL